MTLDGDIDFKAESVTLLVDRMRKNKKVGAACGRIHPIGTGGNLSHVALDAVGFSYSRAWYLQVPDVLLKPDGSWRLVLLEFVCSSSGVARR